MVETPKRAQSPGHGLVRAIKAVHTRTVSPMQGCSSRLTLRYALENVNIVAALGHEGE